MISNIDHHSTAFQNEVAGRFGVLPNFFCSAGSAPGLIEELWGFAKSAYLDSPLPSLFKERLFVHLSRFCEVRYCIVRHVGFLIGHGRPAGDSGAPAHTIDQVIVLLRRPVPNSETLLAALERLRAQPLAPLPAPEMQAEADLFDALTIMFVDPTRSESARQAIRVSVGDSLFEILTAYLAFIRTAHYWTETHPELTYESDMLELMEQWPDLGGLLLDTSDADRYKPKQDVREITTQLHKAERALRDSELRLAGQKEAFQAAVNGEPLETSLGMLVRTVTEYTRGKGRSAFYLANPARTALRHITGMPESYAKQVDGFKIGPESLACDLTNYSGLPAITADVNDDPRWKEWLWLAQEYGYRGCWSFPIETVTGKVVGTFAMYHENPSEPTQRDHELAQSITQAAAIIISRHEEAIERRQAEVTQHLLLGELNHRVKNTLATVQSIVQMTLRHTKDPGEFAKTFAGRMESLARVHGILTDATWHGADLRSLINDQLLSGVMEQGQLIADGPDVHLPPQFALHLALMLHELGTNAAKYGALSAAGGSIFLDWSVVESTLKLRWKERGGPRVRVPSRRGFGSRLIESTAKGDGGRAQPTFEADGITWEIDFPLSTETFPPTKVPAVEGKAPVRHPAPVAALHAPLAGMRLLIVEDEPLVAMDCAEALEHAGAVIAGIVGNLADALRDIEKLEFDGALLDANLYGQTVDAAAAALTRRGVPFIFVSGYNKEALPRGFAHTPVLAKPYRTDSLIAAVESLRQRPPPGLSELKTTPR